VRLVQPEIVATSLLRAGQGSPLHNGHGGQRPKKRTQVGGFGRSVGPLARGWLRHSVRGGRRSSGLLKSLQSSRRVFRGGYGSRLVKIFRAKVPERRTTSRRYQVTFQFAQGDSCWSNRHRCCGTSHLEPCYDVLLGSATRNRAITRVPFFMESIWSVPPNCRTLSCIPRIPTPASPCEANVDLCLPSMPFPSSSMHNRNTSPSYSRDTVAVALPE
jgi:hypothetical protein